MERSDGLPEMQTVPAKSSCYLFKAFPDHGIDCMSARTESTALDWLVANGWQVTHVTVGAGDT